MFVTLHILRRHLYVQLFNDVFNLDKFATPFVCAGFGMNVPAATRLGPIWGHRAMRMRMIDLCAAVTRVCIGDGSKAKFQDSLWLEGIRPIDIVPKIFELSRMSSCSVWKALLDNWCVNQINRHHVISARASRRLPFFRESFAMLITTMGCMMLFIEKFTLNTQ